MSCKFRKYMEGYFHDLSLCFKHGVGVDEFSLSKFRDQDITKWEEGYYPKMCSRVFTRMHAEMDKLGRTGLSPADTLCSALTEESLRNISVYAAILLFLRFRWEEEQAAWVNTVKGYIANDEDEAMEAEAEEAEEGEEND